jgi:hypothetical protein
MDKKWMSTCIGVVLGMVVGKMLFNTLEDIGWTLFWSGGSPDSQGFFTPDKIEMMFNTSGAFKIWGGGLVGGVLGYVVAGRSPRFNPLRNSSPITRGATVSPTLKGYVYFVILAAFMVVGLHSEAIKAFLSQLTASDPLRGHTFVGYAQNRTREERLVFDNGGVVTRTFSDSAGSDDPQIISYTYNERGDVVIQIPATTFGEVCPIHGNTIYDPNDAQFFESGDGPVTLSRVN